MKIFENIDLEYKVKFVKQVRRYSIRIKNFKELRFFPNEKFLVLESSIEGLKLDRS